jgi:hypothetical protein
MSGSKPGRIAGRPAAGNPSRSREVRALRVVAATAARAAVAARADLVVTVGHRSAWWLVFALGLRRYTSGSMWTRA